MAEQPAVIFIARHGPRLDAADSTWHLSTPTPYDPPITYGGWNQSRTLGTRIASLLHAREQDYGSRGGDTSGGGDTDDQERPAKRRRLRHKVVIHSSPFLRCLQTSIAIAAGMAQYNPSIESENKQKRPLSASPRMRAPKGGGTPRALSSIAEPKYDLAHAIARKTLYEHKRHRKSKLRVDAFLGEWLNPQYFEGITAPPPSAMMVTAAKAELMENEIVEIFQPTVVTKNLAGNSLWGGANGSRPGSRESPLDDWSPVEEAIPKSPSRSRSNSQSSPIINECGRKSPFRPSATLLQPLASTLPKQETSIYRPPTPQYAVSASHQIPRGYVAHARNACTDVDYSWDSSRAPHAWGDGGKYGEEWSQMHKRYRKGIEGLASWYSGSSDGTAADNATGSENEDEQAEESEQEDLVVILVTHGAGCNALIGALTGQPVLLDVGMASLTMAVRTDGTSRGTASRKQQRRGSIDSGLSSAYEMKLVASTEHLRPGTDMRKSALSKAASNTKPSRDAVPRFHARPDPDRSNTNTALGTIRRPSTASIPKGASQSDRSGSSSGNEPGLQVPTQPVSVGLWTPPTGRSPALTPQPQSPGEVPQLGHTNFGNENMSTSSSDNTGPDPSSATVANGPAQSVAHGNQQAQSVNSDPDSDGLLTPGDDVPPELSRRMSQQGLWGSRPSGAQIERKVRQPKRRWTVEQD